MSRFSVIETGGTQQLATVTGLLSVRAVAGGSIFQEFPEQYPGATFSLIDADILKKEPIAGHVHLGYRVNAIVIVYAASDGLEIGDARGSAWTYVDAAISALTGFVPVGMPTGTACYPFVPGNPQTVAMDTGKYAVMVPFTIDLLWTI